MDSEELEGKLERARRIGKVLLGAFVGWTIASFVFVSGITDIELFGIAYLLGSGMGVMVCVDIIEGKR